MPRRRRLTARTRTCACAGRRKEGRIGGRQGLMRGRGARHRIGSQWTRDSALAILLMLKWSSHLHCICARSHAPTSKSAGQREPRNDRRHALPCWATDWTPCLPLHEVHGMNVLASSGTSAPAGTASKMPVMLCLASRARPSSLPPSLTLRTRDTSNAPHRPHHRAPRRKEDSNSKPIQTWVNKGVYLLS